MTEWRRSWLRPRWYVTQTGLGAARPDTILATGPTGGPVDCAQCGKRDLWAWFSTAGGRLCGDCANATRAPEPAAGRWRRLWWQLSPWDGLYWAYCRRFGHRVPHPADDPKSP